MECYDQLGTIGEGTYGVVLKARHRESQQVVAIKKFKESDGEFTFRDLILASISIVMHVPYNIYIYPYLSDC
jgi:cyclin-dependent kinase-like